MEEQRTVTVVLDLSRIRQQIEERAEVVRLELQSLAGDAFCQARGQFLGHLLDSIRCEYVSAVGAGEVTIRPEILGDLEMRAVALGAIGRDAG